MAAYREGGEAALKAKPVPGRPSKLSGAQLRTLYTLIEGADPRQYQLQFALWTRELVQQLIWSALFIGYPVVSRRAVVAHPGLLPAAPGVPRLPAGSTAGSRTGGSGVYPGHP